LQLNVTKRRISAFCSLALCCCLASGTVALTQDDSSGGEAGMVMHLFEEGNGIRGTVVSAATGSLIVRTRENETYKVFYSQNTRIMKNRQPIDASAIHPGDMLAAAGQIDRKKKTMGAVFMFDVDEAAAEKAREEFGKTWTAGKVKSVRGLSIVIDRTLDGKTQTILVDENTSFKKHGESVTLADIEPGDFISARGALRNKNFTATLVRSMGPQAGMADPNSPEGPAVGVGPSQ
jgi:hypothetical protein